MEKAAQEAAKRPKPEKFKERQTVGQIFNDLDEKKKKGGRGSSSSDRGYNHLLQQGASSYRPERRTARRG
eukprot:CAMPEP_0182500734 /NCGR_PEP_ID=MMETSP1321-20130603/9838_1 /TAXON_ID=91990 /ORGANISM="Bolidomonas sp., Strain RCC1657" /LENGTH=69 /DNA_ID=CAMNT_0024705245 /DNA_START=203 /DNA_END=412 /DNA_ORIENTATION=-